MKFRRKQQSQGADAVDVPIRDEMIRLGQFLKLANLIENGADAKIVCPEGLVTVSGEIETRNMADSLAYSAEKTLRDNADKVPADLKTEVEGKIAAVRSALEGSDKGAIESAVGELNAALSKIGEAVYGAQAGADDGSGEAGPGEAPEGTVEGEFREACDFATAPFDKDRIGVGKVGPHFGGAPHHRGDVLDGEAIGVLADKLDVLGILLDSKRLPRRGEGHSTRCRPPGSRREIRPGGPGEADVPEPAHRLRRRAVPHKRRGPADVEERPLAGQAAGVGVTQPVRE